ncbi:MAG: hypothetical protein V4559_13325 [Pseudomonadota bacterium]
MTWKNAAILFTTLALVAASPVAVMGAQANKPAAAKPGTPRPVKNAMPPGPLLFHGYACSGDCTSHQEGYSWASAHKIANPMDCRGTSETFIEGCRAYAGIEGPLGEREIFQDED